MISPQQESRITGETVEQVIERRRASAVDLKFLDDQLRALGYDPAAYSGPLLGSLQRADGADDPAARLAAILVAARANLVESLEQATRIVVDAAVQRELGRIAALDAVEYADQAAREMIPGLIQRPTFRELAAMRQDYAPVHEIRAVPGWSPVAIPGRPGWWRHCSPDGQQVDLPTRDTIQEAA